VVLCQSRSRLDMALTCRDTLRSTTLDEFVDAAKERPDIELGATTGLAYVVAALQKEEESTSPSYGYRDYASGVQDFATGRVSFCNGINRCCRR